MSLPVSMDVLSVISMEEPEFDVWTVRSVEPLELWLWRVASSPSRETLTLPRRWNAGSAAIDIAGRLVDGSTVECMAPYHIADTVEVGINGAMGLSLDYIKPNIVDISWSEVEADLSSRWPSR